LPEAIQPSIVLVLTLKNDARSCLVNSRSDKASRSGLGSVTARLGCEAVGVSLSAESDRFIKANYWRDLGGRQMSGSHQTRPGQKPTIAALFSAVEGTPSG
jgi:hypothetical protein